MKITLKGTVKYSVMLLIMAALLFLAFRSLSWSDLIEGVKACNVWWILAVIAVQWLITFLRGNRWRIMMRPLSKEITRRETYDSYALCYLANLAFPRSGEVVRCGLIADTGKATFQGSLGTVVIERTWDMLCVFIGCIPLLFVGKFRDFLIDKMFRPAAGSIHFGWAIWLVLAILVLAVILAVSLVRRNGLKPHTPLGAKILKFFRGLADGIKAGFTMERKWAFFGYTLIIWIGYILASYWTMLAFPPTSGLSIWDAIFITIVGSLGWIVPVQGGFGAYHVIVAMTLVPIYGLEYNTGLIFATISHETQVVQMILCGLISLVSWTLYKKKITRKTETCNC